MRNILWLVAAFLSGRALGADTVYVLENPKVKESLQVRLEGDTASDLYRWIDADPVPAAGLGDDLEMSKAGTQVGCIEDLSLKTMKDSKGIEEESRNIRSWHCTFQVSTKGAIDFNPDHVFWKHTQKDTNALSSTFSKLAFNLTLKGKIARQLYDHLAEKEGDKISCKVVNALRDEVECTVRVTSKAKL